MRLQQRGMPLAAIQWDRERPRLWDAEAGSLFYRRRDFAAGADSSDLIVAAGFFLPSIWARLCFSAAIRSTTGASFFGFSTAATSPPSSLASISFFKFSWKESWYFSGSHSSASA